MKLFFGVVSLFVVLVTAQANGQTCELAKKFEPYSKAFKGDPIKDPSDPVAGVKYLTAQDAIKFFKDSNYVFVDTRPKALFEKCQIRDAVNLEYEFDGSPQNQLSKDTIKKLEGKTIIFYCNDLACYRSMNAAVAACKWGIPADKIKWLGPGVPGVVKAFPKEYRKYVTGKGCADFLM